MKQLTRWRDFGFGKAPRALTICQRGTAQGLARAGMGFVGAGSRPGPAGAISKRLSGRFCTAGISTRTPIWPTFPPPLWGRSALRGTVGCNAFDMRLQSCAGLLDRAAREQRGDLKMVRQGSIKLQIGPHKIGGCSDTHLQALPGFDQDWIAARLDDAKVERGVQVGERHEITSGDRGGHRVAKRPELSGEIDWIGRRTLNG